MRRASLKRFRVKLKGLLTHEDFQAGLADVDKAVRLQALEKPQAEIDTQTVDSTARIIKAVEGKNAVVVVGPLIIISLQPADGPGSVFSHWLTPDQRRILDQQRHVLMDPVQAISVLMAPGSRPSLRSGADDPAARGDAP